MIRPSVASLEVISLEVISPNVTSLEVISPNVTSLETIRLKEERLFSYLE